LHEEVQTIDSTLFYERKNLEIAELNNDLAEQIKLNHFIGITLLEGGDISGAKEVTLYAMALCKQADNNSRLPRIYGNLADIYQEENKIDSALYYAKMALMSTNDNRYKSVFYETLSDIEESRGNFQKSLEYLHFYIDYADSLYNQNQKYNILEVQKKYNFVSIQNANRKLIIEKLWIFIALIISVLFLIIILFYIYRKRTLNKEAILVARQQIHQLKEMISKRKKEENDANKKLRDALYEQLDIIKKVSLLEGFLGDDTKLPGNVILRKVNKIIYKSNENFDWNTIFQSVNALYEDYLIRLKNTFPSLTEDEILVCCLLKIGFNNEEISLLLKSGTNFAQKKKTSIRKKTGMKKQEHFMKQLDELIKKEY